MHILLATTNAGKLREMRAVLGDLPVTFSALSDHGLNAPHEHGTSFTANALSKARYAAHATGVAVLADDSGLEVDALGGAPGIHSARYAGADADDAANRAHLLAEVAAHPEPLIARFRCVAVFMASPNAAPCIAEGVWCGRIQKHAKGDCGFGYDALFFVPQHQRTAAEIKASVKNALSHRGQALRALRPHIMSALIIAPAH